MPPGKRSFRSPIVPVIQPDVIQPSASVHSTMDTAGSSTSSTAAKRPRGRTKGKDLDRLNQSTGSNMIIEIPKDKGRPVDYKQSAKLSNELGIIARNLIPVPTKWKNLSEEDKDYAFERIKGRFQIQLDDTYVRTSCEDLLKGASRNERYRLHKRFESYNSTEEARRNPPRLMSEDNSNALCDLFQDPGYQTTCGINKNNRSKLTISHNKGSRAFVVERHFLRNKETNVEPDRIDFYKMTHWHKDKGWACRGAEEKHGEMVRLRGLLDDEGNPTMTPDEIVDQVLGVKSGYIKGLGFGPKPKTSKLAQQRAENQLLLARIEALEAAQAAKDEEYRAEREAAIIRERKMNKMFDALLASGVLPSV